MKEIRTKRIKDITGQTFHRLTILNLHHRDDDGRVFYECQCSCGNRPIVVRCNILRGITRSCGCYKNEYLKKLYFTGCGDLHGRLFHHIEYHAKRRKIPFQITCEQAWNQFLKQNHQCAISGEPLRFNKYYSDKNQTASLDRIDSSKGYTVDNIQWIHKIINKMKMELSESVFLDWVRKINLHNPLTK